MSNDGKIVCKIDGARVHSIKKYLELTYPEWTVQRYRDAYPGEPLLSDKAKEMINQRREEMKEEIVVSADVEMKPFYEVFGLPQAAGLNASGEAIKTPVFTGLEPELQDLIPPVDLDYLFPIEPLKSVIIAAFMKTPTYIWGFHGTGKTTLLEQWAARVKRPFMRVQHTVNSEESHIIGQYVVRDGSTHFNYGPLAIAMRDGLVYCADEYDRAPAPVLSVYQPVLEGKALYIKEAPPEMRMIKPHPNFLFVATGNTNGSGDETGLYQGTLMQDAANYSRFGMTVKIDYLDAKVEATIIAQKAKIKPKDAKQLADFAANVREAYSGGRIGSTISPRELINAGKIGAIRGGLYRQGLNDAWGSRLGTVDREIVDGFAQRVFG